MKKKDLAETNSSSLSLSDVLEGDGKKKYGRMVVAALGSIPWVGGAIAASAALHSEKEQSKVNQMFAQWMDEHETKIELLSETINKIANRLNALPPEMHENIDYRLNDEKFLALVRRSFRTWDTSDTNEKRDYVRCCITNAAATKLCSDDVIRLFIDWIKKYDEMHFRIIRALYNNRGATRAFLWDEVHGEAVREDSAEADLYKLLIFDLNTGRVLRQIRDKNQHGQFLSKRRQARVSSNKILESAFENTKPYELTELGSQFVHYVMDEVAPQISN